MSRAGYNDDGDGDNWSLIRWRGAVASAIKGARGQALLRELAAAMDAMPEKVLIAGAAAADGCVCTLGVVAQARGLDLQALDADMQDWEWDSIAKQLGVSPALVREVMWENDEVFGDDRWIEFEVCGPMRQHWPDWGKHKRTALVPDPTAGARRWRYMRDWVAKHLAASPAEPAAALGGEA